VLKSSSPELLHVKSPSWQKISLDIQNIKYFICNNIIHVFWQFKQPVYDSLLQFVCIIHKNKIFPRICRSRKGCVQNIRAHLKRVVLGGKVKNVCVNERMRWSCWISTLIKDSYRNISEMSGDFTCSSSGEEDFKRDCRKLAAWIVKIHVWCYYK
jgi:hypothetical protein